MFAVSVTYTYWYDESLSVCARKGERYKVCHIRTHAQRHWHTCESDPCQQVPSVSMHTTMHCNRLTFDWSWIVCLITWHLFNIKKLNFSSISHMTRAVHKAHSVVVLCKQMQWESQHHTLVHFRQAVCPAFHIFIVCVWLWLLWSTHAGVTYLV